MVNVGLDASLVGPLQSDVILRFNILGWICENAYLRLLRLVYMMIQACYRAPKSGVYRQEIVAQTEEGWPSGLRRTPGKRVGVNAPPGFESPSLRHSHTNAINCLLQSLADVFVRRMCTV